MTVAVPTEYKQFLESHGAFEGFMDGEPGYIALWSVEELLGNNADIQIEQYAPGFIAFAGNGGGEVLAFDSSGAVFMLPLIGMEPRYAIPIAASFSDLATRFQLVA